MPEPTSRQNDEPERADAAELFREERTRKTPEPRTPSPTPGSGDVFDLVEGDERDDSPEAPAPTAAPRARPGAERRPRSERERDRDREPEPRVDEVWSRQAEWGPTVMIVAFAGLVVLILLYAMLSAGSLGGAFLVFVLGAAAVVALSYPILITLERPVRLTPEQAARDYFGALSHQVPHYRRMWLLLSTPGRTSPEFQSFDSFKAYWKRRLAELRSRKPGARPPLMFEVREFKAEKSAGKSVVEGKFTVVVTARGADGEPLESIRTRAWIVRGPDNMWYLNDGALP